MIDYKKEIIEKINNLGLHKISVSEVKYIAEDKYQVKIYGGFNKDGNWVLYLEQIKEIFDCFDNCKSIYLEELLDDTWVLIFSIII